MEVFSWLFAHWLELLAGVVGLLAAILIILNLIPGDQGEGFIEKIKNFLNKFLPKK